MKSRARERGEQTKQNKKPQGFCLKRLGLNTSQDAWDVAVRRGRDERVTELSLPLSLRLSPSLFSLFFFFSLLVFLFFVERVKTTRELNVLFLHFTFTIKEKRKRKRKNPKKKKRRRRRRESRKDELFFPFPIAKKRRKKREKIVKSAHNILSERSSFYMCRYLLYK